MKNILIAIGITGTSIAAIAGTAFAQRGEMPSIQLNEVKVDPANPAIDLSVSTNVMSAPDVANFSTGVETRAPKANDAIAKNAEKMAAVVAQLKAAGIDAKDIQTSAIALSRDVTYLPNGTSKFKGFRVGNRVTAKLRDLSRLGSLLDALTAAGATEFDGPNFQLENNSAAEAEARDKAWSAALDKARYHAKKAGFSDVRVMRVAEAISQTVNSEPVYETRQALMDSEIAMNAASAVVGESSLEVGEIQTNVTLAISFQMVR
jgi:uncharacterized protein